MVVEITSYGKATADKRLVRKAALLAHRLAGGRLACLSVVLTDDTTMSELNRRLLGRDGPTDVIAFEAEEEPDGPSAEIYVNVDAARRQGEEYGLGFSGELCFLVAHGVLHALGFSDDTDQQRQQMFELQNRVVELVRSGDHGKA